MLPFEWFAVIWFTAQCAATPFSRAPLPRQLAVMVACAALVLVIGFAAPGSSPGVRAWLPHAYLVLGYWLPGLLVSAPSVPTRFETWLLGTDDALRPALPATPAFLVPLVELAYLVCYPLVPAAFAIVWTQGGPADVNRFWVAVLGAGYACYGSLPWLVSRPPRVAVASRAVRHAVATANVLVLARVSHQLNTFPSGHVAVSCAAAGVVAGVSPAAGAMVGSIAIAIATGAAAGRYHYVIDVALGAAIGVMAVGTAAALG